MALRIEDYALIGDMQAAALVGKDGSIDWLCLPRFDSPALFASLLGDTGNGRWSIAPRGEVRSCRRSYRKGTLVLETELRTDQGTVRIVDCMPPRQKDPDVLRMIEGVEGTVDLDMELIIRFDYGSVVPWVRHTDDGLTAVAGPDAIVLRTPVEIHGEDMKTVAEFSVAKGDRIPFVLTWYPSHHAMPQRLDPFVQLEDACLWWTEWASRCDPCDDWRDSVMSSLIVLKALTYAPTGGVVAAPTTSLPELVGGTRNWDYRYCWLRDATFTLYALMLAGYTEEASQWRDWLLRAIAGNPEQMQILYGPAGERRLEEYEVGWLPGYESSAPVRVGNAACNQFQLDVYGEVMDALHQARRQKIQPEPEAWNLQLELLNFLEGAWRKPDAGIWEVRGPHRHFTHSKVMAWVAFDRATKAVEQMGLEGPVERFRAAATEIRGEVLSKGYSSERRSFTQHFETAALDASVLLMPLVGFISPADERMRSTVEAIRAELEVDGFLRRYLPDESGEVDGIPESEGTFIPCTLWLADNLALAGNAREANEIFERVLGVANDVGLLSEEYDPHEGRLLGNFPQAFSHVGLVNTAHNLSRVEGPAGPFTRAK